jgi:hypothetical protein
MRTILFIVIITSLTTISGANVGLQMDFYNSNDGMSMSLDGSNLGFGASSSLMPDSIKYDNGGSSNEPAAEYSYSLTLNADNAFCGAKTDSGGFAWAGKVDTSGDNEKLKVVAVSSVKNGNLNDYYGNNKFEVQEVSKAENSGYAQQALIKPDSVNGGGSGSTIKPVPGLVEALMARTGNRSSTSNAQSETSLAGNSNPSETTVSESKDQGLIYSMKVQNVETKKHGSIDSNLMGRTEAQWSTNAIYVPGACLFGAKVRGIAFAPTSELDMTGKDTDFPTQILPPGTVDISYTDPIKTTKPTTEQTKTPEPGDQYPGLVDSAYKDVDSAYPGITTPALWYYLHNLYQINIDESVIIPPESHPTYTPSTALERFDFGMGFDTK